MKYNEPYKPHNSHRRRGKSLSPIAAVFLIFLGMIAGVILTTTILYHAWVQ